MRPLAAAMFVIISLPAVLLFAQFLRSRAFFKSSNSINPDLSGFRPSILSVRRSQPKDKFLNLKTIAAFQQPCQLRVGTEQIIERRWLIA
jgi:hypothetical protein